MEEPLDRSLGGEDARTLSVPLLNVLNGGTHATNNVASQEFMIVPADARSFHKALRIGAEIFAARKRLLQEKGLTTAVGDEGGVAATEFYDNGEYIFRKADGVVRIAADLVELYRRWAEQYPLMSIEDGLAEDNWDGWR